MYKFFSHINKIFAIPRIFLCWRENNPLIRICKIRFRNRRICSIRINICCLASIGRQYGIAVFNPANIHKCIRNVKTINSF